MWRLEGFTLNLCNKKGCKPYNRLQPQALHWVTYTLILIRIS